MEWKWKKEDEDGCNYLHVFRDLQRQIEEDEEWVYTRDHNDELMMMMNLAPASPLKGNEWLNTLERKEVKPGLVKEEIPVSKL